MTFCQGKKEKKKLVICNLENIKLWCSRLITISCLNCCYPLPVYSYKSHGDPNWQVWGKICALAMAEKLFNLFFGNSSFLWAVPKKIFFKKKASQYTRLPGGFISNPWHQVHNGRFNRTIEAGPLWSRVIDSMWKVFLIF